MYSVEPGWQVKCRTARSSRDVRPMKPMSDNKKFSDENRYQVLCSVDEEGDDEEREQEGDLVEKPRKKVPEKRKSKKRSQDRYTCSVDQWVNSTDQVVENKKRRVGENPTKG